MKMINVYKSPISKEKYANLFLDKIPGNVKNVCLLFIGHSETVHYIMSQKPEIQFTVIDGADVTEALPYIYNGANLKESITFEDSWCEDETFLKKLKASFENYNISNMSFDFIIANPPYGKGLYRNIIRKILEVNPSMCCALTPWDWVQGSTSAGFRQEIRLGSLEKIDNTKKQVFNISYKYLACFLFGNGVDKPLQIEGYWEKLEIDPLEKACKDYNKRFPWGDRSAVNSSFEGMKKKGGNVENTFLLGCWKTTKESWVREWNLNKDEGVVYKPTKKGGAPIATNGIFSARYFIMRNENEKNNVSNWFYNSNLFPSGIPNSCLPHLDWSHPWTDKEILKEIGLPEDFLEKEQEQ